MKKKVVLVVAVLMMAITSMALLVGCVPNRPDKFVGNWIISDKKGVEVGNAQYGISGNKMICKLSDDTQTIYEDKGDQLNVYTCVAGSWSAVSLSKEEAEKQDHYKKINENLNNENVKKVLDYVQEKFEQNFEKDKEGWWNMKPINLASAKIENGKMSMKLAAVELPFKLVLNFKISIPSEAKAALKK